MTTTQQPEALRFRKKPVVIEAFQMTEERRASNADWPEWMHQAWQLDREAPGSLYPTEEGTGDGTLSIGTLEGPHLVSWGDWIIQGVKGELYPCKPDIFEATYAPETAPVALPKPVGWFHRHPEECKSGEVCNYRIASADKKYGWEEFPLYTEQQVHALLTGVPTPAAYADTKDAARYRWLRDNDWRNDEKMEPVIRLHLNAIWDEKIDAAMAAQTKKEGEKR